MHFRDPPFSGASSGLRRSANRSAKEAQRKRRPELQRLGYFGPYARGDWSVGSDLDLVAVVERSSERFERRYLSWDSTNLPVPAELLVYTADEWESLKREGERFIRMLEREIVWVFLRSD
jgi:hypothetical protein